MSSCRMMRRRDAPSDSRMPISRWRETPRASCRLATLAQPIIRISPNAKKIGREDQQRLDRHRLESVPCLGLSLMDAGGRRSALRARRLQIGSSQMPTR